MSHIRHFSWCRGVAECLCSVILYALVLIITCVVCSIEFIGAKISGSLALKSDAIHALMDGGGALIALAVEILTRRNRIFEWRIRGMGGILSGSSLAILAGFVLYECGSRFFSIHDIEATSMLLVATVGLAGNLVAWRILHYQHEKDITHESALLHIIIDTALSLAVIVGAVAILFTDIHHIDTVVSLVIAIVMMVWAARLIRKSARIVDHKVLV